MRRGGCPGQLELSGCLTVDLCAVLSRQVASSWAVAPAQSHVELSTPVHVMGLHRSHGMSEAAGGTGGLGSDANLQWPVSDRGFVVSSQHAPRDCDVGDHYGPWALYPGMMGDRFFSFNLQDQAFSRSIVRSLAKASPITVARHKKLEPTGTSFASCCSQSIHRPVLGFTADGREPLRLRQG
jgi:hypothetical protein